MKQWRGTRFPFRNETGAAVPYSGNPNLNASREPGHNFKVMKKFILCLLAVAAGMSAFGQGRVMGVRAGLNVTSIDLSAGSNSFSFDSVRRTMWALPTNSRCCGRCRSTWKRAFT